MKKIVMLAAAATLMLGACATAPTTTKDDAMSAISMAKQETAKAKKVNYEWRDTGTMIKDAEKALDEGKDEEALKLANAALALYCMDEGKGLANSVERATRSLKSGAALETFKKLVNS